jgi:hypothetical protein
MMLGRQARRKELAMSLSLIRTTTALGVLSIPLLFAACTLKATTKETTDTTSNITGTTSGRAWWNEDGLLKQEHKIAAFTAYNQQNLELDLARGGGEYLASLQTLIEAPTPGSFAPQAQDAYGRSHAAGPASYDGLIRQFRQGSIR